MADAFYRRVSGREVEAAVPGSRSIWWSPTRSALAQGSEPAVLRVMTAPSRQRWPDKMVLAALLDPQAEAAVRKLYADPATGNLVYGVHPPGRSPRAAAS